MNQRQAASRQPTARAKQPTSSVSRPFYPPGSIRMRRWSGLGDVRAYVPPAGWTASADLTDVHPIHGTPLPGSQWWIFETRQ